MWQVAAKHRPLSTASSSSSLDEITAIISISAWVQTTESVIHHVRFGLWLSLVERFVRDEEVVGSTAWRDSAITQAEGHTAGPAKRENPASPTTLRRWSYSRNSMDSRPSKKVSPAALIQPNLSD